MGSFLLSFGNVLFYVRTMGKSLMEVENIANLHDFHRRNL